MLESERRENNAEAILEGEAEKGDAENGVADAEDSTGIDWEEGIEDDEQDGDGGGMKHFLAMNNDDEIPGFRIEGIGTLDEGERAEGLLKLLLPLAKVVKERTKEDDAKTMEMVDKRERREKWEKNMKGEGGGQQTIKKNRVGYYEKPPKF